MVVAGAIDGSEYSKSPPASEGLDRLTSELTIGDDAAFFERNPKRRFRLRLADAGEASLYAEYAGPPTDPAMFVLTLVRQLVPGVRVREWLWATPDLLSHDNDATGNLLWQHLHGAPHERGC